MCCFAYPEQTQLFGPKKEGLIQMHLSLFDKVRIVPIATHRRDQTRNQTVNSYHLCIPQFMRGLLFPHPSAGIYYYYYYYYY